LFSCFALPKPRALSGTSLLITDPAATVALVPTVTGATRDELLPIKLLSPIIVLCLSLPS
jgi:hypothetical protein